MEMVTTQPRRMGGGGNKKGCGATKLLEVPGRTKEVPSSKKYIFGSPHMLIRFPLSRISGPLLCNSDLCILR